MENRPHAPLCDQCEGDHELTVKHILIECIFLKIIDFVKDIGLYNSL